MTTKKKTLQRVVIMAGGTGGHVFPGLALAKEFMQRGVDVHWLGTEHGLEARVVPDANIPLHFIKIGGLRGKGLKTKLTAPIKILSAILQAKRILARVQPDIVIGMGGFASGPGGVASWLLRRPLIIHEQNAKAGLTNRSLATLAVKILQGFPGAFKPSKKVVTVGNPVRSELETLLPPATRLNQHPNPPQLLVLGGSLGAQALNELVPAALALLPLDERPSVFHQTGLKQVEATEKLYKSMGVDAILTAFVEDMAGAYSAADMVLCRAGALTIAELCAVGLGAILVPFPHAVDDHQTANAEFMVKNQAALCIQQSDLTPERLKDIVREFIQRPARRIAMAEAAYQSREVKVAEKIYHICQEVCR